jgi:hypothetical protein
MRHSWSFLGAKIPLARADEHIGLRHRGDNVRPKMRLGGDL